MGSNLPLAAAILIKQTMELRMRENADQKDSHSGALRHSRLFLRYHRKSRDLIVTLPAAENLRSG
jgi:hypothetical protein